MCVFRINIRLDTKLGRTLVESVIDVIKKADIPNIKPPWARNPLLYIYINRIRFQSTINLCNDINRGVNVTVYYVFIVVIA